MKKLLFIFVILVAINLTHSLFDEWFFGEDHEEIGLY